ncbi:MAG: aminotransferase class V-fold PLP-dependent enzyme [Bacteroidetes bacterium]|nr:MAG: aminotransferase class V-fold PLP-dependent enzyme [Bacteroidota bacterium]
MSTEKYFQPFREQIIGHQASYRTPYGPQQVIYADWIGSGRLYWPIEKRLLYDLGPFVANTHTETSETGKLMTRAYRYAHERIKELVHAGPHDVILTTGFGMTGAIVKFQRILGLKVCGPATRVEYAAEEDRPVVFLTHMEHHSNHTSWYETLADVVVIDPGEDLLVDLTRLEEALIRYRYRKLKIGSFTACSNVTGIHTPVHRMAGLMHRYGGLAFVDYAASAPYEPIDMHPDNPEERLDAVFFSPHKFLGGPGSSGVLVFNSSLYHNPVPDQPGGGTVDWTNPWGEYKYLDNIELREDGGTPGFLQAIKTALAMELKEQMGTDHMLDRERDLNALVFAELDRVPGLHILAGQVRERLGVFSFYLDDIHYNLVVRLLSDRFGIQMRGGCACAGTYGHFLLNVDREKSHAITELINHGDLSLKPGWVRLSLHPTMLDEEVRFIADALKQIRANHAVWQEDYTYNKHTNEFEHPADTQHSKDIRSWFVLD